jgi:membrane protease YdiL (CAAX protease family)
MNKSKIFNRLALFILLIAGFPYGDFALNIFRLFNATAFSSWANVLRSIQNSTSYVWENFSFVLVGVVILANRDNLIRLKIDKVFLTLFIASGILYCRYYFWPLGWAALLVSGFIAYTLVRNVCCFEYDVRINSRRIVLFLVVAFLLYWSFKIEYIAVPSVDNYINVFLTRLPFWLVEEIVFRGLLWMYLEELNLPSLAIMLIQALSFWIFHVNSMFSAPLDFWLIIPIGCIFFGVLVWRYGSITPSAIAHILVNLR